MEELVGIALKFYGEDFLEKILNSVDLKLSIVSPNGQESTHSIFFDDASYEA